MKMAEIESTKSYLISEFKVGRTKEEKWNLNISVLDFVIDDVDASKDSNFELWP